MCIIKQLFVFSYLHPKNAKDDEECTTDEDNVANGFKGGDEGLHHQLQTWSSANHPEEGGGVRGRYEIQITVCVILFHLNILKIALITSKMAPFMRKNRFIGEDIID